MAALLAAAAVGTALRVLAPPDAATVPVLVAARDLPAGVRLSEGDLETRQLPAAAVPEGMADGVGGRVLAGAVNRGEPLTDVRLVGPALGRASPGEQAVPVRIPDPGAVALLRAGDEIDLIATDPGTGEARLLVSGVRVLAVPSELPSGASEGAVGALVVLSLSPDRVSVVAGASLVEFLSIAFGR